LTSKNSADYLWAGGTTDGKYLQAAQVAASAEKRRALRVDERLVLLSDEGFAEAELLLEVKDLLTILGHYIFNAIKAKELFLGT